jgi:hypothetical protein
MLVSQLRLRGSARVPARRSVAYLMPAQTAALGPVAQVAAAI